MVWDRKIRDAEAAANGIIELWKIEQSVPTSIIEHWKEMMLLDSEWGHIFINTLNNKAPHVSDLFNDCFSCLTNYNNAVFDYQAG